MEAVRRRTRLWRPCPVSPSDTCSHAPGALPCDACCSLSAALAALCAAAPPRGAAAGRLLLVARPPGREAADDLHARCRTPSIAAYALGPGRQRALRDRADASGPKVSPHLPERQGLRDRAADRGRQGGVSQKRKAVTVVADMAPNRPPEASFVFFPAGPVAGELITFVSTSTDRTHRSQRPACDWDLNGDGIFDDAEGPSATTTFPVAGTYTISLRITTNATDVGDVGAERGRARRPRDQRRPARAFSAEPVPGRADRRAGLAARRPDPPPHHRRAARHQGSRCGAAGEGARSSACCGPSPLRVVPNAAAPHRLLRIRRVEGRLLRPGVKLRLFVTRPDAVGKYTRFGSAGASRPAVPTCASCLVAADPSPARRGDRLAPALRRRQRRKSPASRAPEGQVGRGFCRCIVRTECVLVRQYHGGEVSAA